jgi:proteic killer suppression protein
MEVFFEDESLKRLEEDLAYDAGFERAIVRAYRMRLQLIRASQDERAFYNMKSLHFEKLKAALDGLHSMRLNKQWRLILKLRKEDSGKLVVVISISDYH